jgi:glycosyltransferase involved in cell wall biosynthesis
MKLACVVHRYGPQATGGSEAHCRAVAQHLAEHHDVTVLTSCATDYVTWRNALPAGESSDGAVRVLRFPVDTPRHLNLFRELSELVFAERASDEEQREWFRANGPSVPGLLAHLERHGRDYDRVLFWSFRYAPTWFGLPLVADRAILVPTAEDDDLMRTSTRLGPFFAQPRAYLFLTPEERDLVAARCDGPLPPFEIIGSGLDASTRVPSRTALDRLGLPQDFLLYLGRVDKNKGSDRLVEAYLRYCEQTPAGTVPVPLVLAGPVVLPLSPHPHIRTLGFVDDATREALLAHALALVMPSPYESLSLVLLEAWNHGTPVLVNGRCQPLRGQVRRANGGLFYDLPEEFVEAVRYLVAERHVARKLGANGLDYVDSEYRWPLVMDKVEKILGGRIKASTVSAD